MRARTCTLPLPISVCLALAGLVLSGAALAQNGSTLGGSAPTGLNNPGTSLGGSAPSGLNSGGNLGGRAPTGLNPNNARAPGTDAFTAPETGGATTRPGSPPAAAEPMRAAPLPRAVAPQPVRRKRVRR
jgi:hypothetical protein